MNKSTEALPPGVTPPEKDDYKGMVFQSRFTPGLENAVNVSLQKGDLVTYKLLNGEKVEATIQSEYAIHDNGCYGWEAIFTDTQEVGFVDERRVIHWKGKC